MKYPAPFKDNEALRMQYISRWGIISMNRQQSVAEHCYNAMVYVTKICKLVGKSPEKYVMYLLFHELDEAYTGDIPSPLKDKEPIYYGCPICKLADMVEAYVYLNNHCNDTSEIRLWVRNRLEEKMKPLLKMLNLKLEDITK